MSRIDQVVSIRVSSLAMVLSALVGCSSHGPDESSMSSTEELAGSPAAINIGFNGGADQFAYFTEFCVAWYSGSPFEMGTFLDRAHGAELLTYLDNLFAEILKVMKLLYLALCLSQRRR